MSIEAPRPGHEPSIDERSALERELLQRRRSREDRPRQGGRADLISQVVSGDLNRPFFFCGLEMHLGQLGRWTAPSALFAIANWAPGRKFLIADSLQELAAGHVQRIRHLQPNGPYMLGGYCHSALIAYEIAQQLKASGEHVSLLFLVDPMPVNRLPGSHETRRATVGSRLRHRLEAILKGPQDGGWLEWLYLFLPKHFRVEWIKRRIDQLSVHRAMRAQESSSSLSYQWIFDAFWHVTGSWFINYKSSPYVGSCQIVLSTDGSPGLRLDQFGAEVKVTSVNVSHAEIFRAHAMDQWVPWLCQAIRVAAAPKRLSEASAAQSQAQVEESAGHVDPGSRRERSAGALGPAQRARHQIEARQRTLVEKERNRLRAAAERDSANVSNPSRTTDLRNNPSSLPSRKARPPSSAGE